MLDKTQINDEKPYNSCINCPFLGVKCDGPNFLAMTPERLVEWCKGRKEHLSRLESKWTNAYIAEQSRISKTTVDRFLSGKGDDLRLSSIVPIIKTLVNGTWGQYPCAVGELEGVNDPELKLRLDKSELECDRLRKVIATKEEERRFLIDQAHTKDNQIAEKDNQMKERADFLRRKDKVIFGLSCSFMASLAAIIVLLIIM